MNRKIVCIMFLLLIIGGATLKSQNIPVHLYEVAKSTWEESFGNHRAVLNITKPAEVVSLDLEWRRPDNDVEKRCFLIVNAETGDTISNIRRMEVTNERCLLQFGPVEKKGIYYFYYLPYSVQHGAGFYSGGYGSEEKLPELSWEAKAETASNVLRANVVKIQSRQAFDSFYPMEVIATSLEKERYRAKNKQPWYLFAESRKNPIRMRTHIPAKWLTAKQGEKFEGNAYPNEYYTFQIGLWAGNEAAKSIVYEASDLRCGAEKILSKQITCFNVEGIDPYGMPFKKRVDVEKGTVQALWFGVDIPSGQKEGLYEGTISIRDVRGVYGKVPLSIWVGGQPLADRGDGDLWRLSRLRWLNSTLGIADVPTHPYTAMTVNENRIGCLGREVTIDGNTGLPLQINSWKNDLLAQPIQFIIQTEQGVKTLEAVPVMTEHTVGHIAGKWNAEDEELAVRCDAVMEFDGWMNYTYTITPKQDLSVKDIRLLIPMKKDIGTYFMGMGLPGQETPQEYDGKWDAPVKTVGNFGVSIPTSKGQQWLWPFDSFWMGNAHAGLHCEFKGSTYSGPLLNLYRPAYPESWFNNGRGGFSVRKEADVVKAVAYSGARTLESGKPLSFDFSMIITPVKPLAMESQFTDRYYHNGAKPVPSEEDIKAGVRIINVHQGNEYNPFINYPFLTVDKMKEFTKKWHERGCKVKLYYTLRELSNALPEIWTLRSLGHEIFRGGKGGGFPWCREHLVTDYTPQWYEHFEYENVHGMVADAAILTAESDSRWYNYYVEGLAWMVRNLDIDGIYLDDVSFDRRILKRMRRAMESVKPGCLIDLHSNTGFSKGPAIQYTEFFPYVDKIWFGESFLYNKMTPANWLVESSGIPFGLTGDMLYKGGNRWLGMQFGMTVRYPWFTEGVNCDPRPVWKIWDEFGIADATMLGFWEQRPAVSTSDEAVKATAYRKEGRTLLSIGNYSDETKTVHLFIDWKQLGLERERARLVAPEIQDMQPACEWNVDNEIVIQPREGWLIYLE